MRRRAVACAAPRASIYVRYLAQPGKKRMRKAFVPVAHH
jgi:hypothetical protein